MRFELTTPTLARLCSTTELRPLIDVVCKPSIFGLQAGVYDKLYRGLQALFLHSVDFLHT